MTEPLGSDRPSGIPGSSVPGPWPVGAYAARLRARLREFARVQVFGEVVNFRVTRKAVWFELRDATGALPCSMWRNEFDALNLELADGMQVVAAGGCDFYPGSRTASPGFSFAVTDLRIAGEGDLLAQLAQLRRTLDSEGLFEPQKLLPRPALPRCIGVVTGETGKARDDVLAGLRRRGWEGRLVWAFAPVQDRHAAGAITQALQDLAACEQVEVVIVARGGGSLADLFCFCDETLCRTVALLRVPVISSVGHHTDRTLLDDVAAAACSTPTHAAETAVPVHCTEARVALHRSAARLDRLGRRAIVERARDLARLSRAPAEHVERHRGRLHQQLREMRAAARRRVAGGDRDMANRALVLHRRKEATALAIARGGSRAAGDATALARAATLARRRTDLERLATTLAAHNPQRTLERGYALVQNAEGDPLTTGAAAAREPIVTVRMADGSFPARPAGPLEADPLGGGDIRPDASYPQETE
jgi:exodeoxyribonuclease VII large subunit